jgi:hypothetical protein
MVSRVNLKLGRPYLLTQLRNLVLAVAVTPPTPLPSPPAAPPLPLSRAPAQAGHGRRPGLRELPLRWDMVAATDSESAPRLIPYRATSVCST